MIGEWNGLIPVVSEDPGGCRILAEERKQRMRSRTPVWGLPKALRCQSNLELLGAVTRSSAKNLQEGYFGHLCPTPARCWTRTWFDLNFKVEFGLGSVIRSEGRQSHQALLLPARRGRNIGRDMRELIRRRFRRRCSRGRNDANDDVDDGGWGTDVDDGVGNCGGGKRS
ncbi:unnamed protein product [Prunus armeniaca]